MKSILRFLVIGLVSANALAQTKSNNMLATVIRSQQEIAPLRSKLAASQFQAIQNFVLLTLVPMSMGQDKLREKTCGIESVWLDLKENSYFVRAKLFQTLNG